MYYDYDKIMKTILDEVLYKTNQIYLVDLIAMKDCFCIVCNMYAIFINILDAIEIIVLVDSWNEIS